jgi:hypothetical protein
MATIDREQVPIVSDAWDLMHAIAKLSRKELCDVNLTAEASNGERHVASCLKYSLEGRDDIERSFAVDPRPEEKDAARSLIGLGRAKKRLRNPAVDDRDSIARDAKAVLEVGPVLSVQDGHLVCEAQG